MVEARKGPRLLRLSVRWPLTIRTQSGDTHGETRNITSEGVFLYCPERLLEGAVYSIRIKAPEKRIEVTGRVTWSNLDYCSRFMSNPAMGFYFVRIDEDKDRRSLGEAIPNHCGEPLEVQREADPHVDSFMGNEVLAVGRR